MDGKTPCIDCREPFKSAVHREPNSVRNGRPQHEIAPGHAIDVHPYRPAPPAPEEAHDE